MRSSEDICACEELLARDHAELDELFGALTAALARGDAAAASPRLDRFWARLAMHIRAEHLHLFPAILAATAAEAAPARPLSLTLGEVRATIAQLRSDHDFFMRESARAVKLMRAATETTDAAGAALLMRDVSRLMRALAERLAAHNRLEEEHVYRLPTTTPGATAQTALAREVERELRNLPPRFSGGNKLS